MLLFEQTRLALVVDQLEELFTHNESTVELRRRFIRASDSLVRSGRPFVIATMRSDTGTGPPKRRCWSNWPQARAPSTSSRRSRRSGRDDPPPGRSRRVSRSRPIRATASGSMPHSPKRRRTSRARSAVVVSARCSRYPRRPRCRRRSAQLRLDAALEASGAIAQRAEAAFTALPSDVQASLPKVLRALVESDSLDAAPVARAASMSRFPEGRPERKLVEAMLAPDVRLFVADGDGEGARIRLRMKRCSVTGGSWPEIVQDRIDLRTLTAVEGAEVEWRAAASCAALCLRDPQLPTPSISKTPGRRARRIDTKFHSTIAATRATRQQLTAAAAIVFAFVAVAAVLPSSSGAGTRAAERSYAAAKSSVATLVFGMAEVWPRRQHECGNDRKGPRHDSDTIAKLAADDPVDRDLQRLHGAMANEIALTTRPPATAQHAFRADPEFRLRRQLAQAEPANPVAP